MIEDALREGLTASIGTQISCESKGFVDRQIGLHYEHGSACHLRLLEHVTAPPVQNTVDSAHSHLGTLQPTYNITSHTTSTSLSTLHVALISWVSYQIRIGFAKLLNRMKMYSSATVRYKGN